MIEVGPLEAGDRDAWEGLARGYKAFYRDWIPDEARALIEQVAQAARDHGATSYYWHTQEGNARARALYDRVARFSGSSATHTRCYAPRCCSAMARTPAMNNSTPNR